VGFACDAVAAAEGEDVTRYGDWLAAKDHLRQPKSLWQNLGDAALAGFSRGN
jgi:allophanate hydrolase